MTGPLTEAFQAYQRLVNNHYAGNEMWTDNVHLLYRHISRAGNAALGAEHPQHVNSALQVIHDMRAALNACEAALLAARAEQAA